MLEMLRETHRLTNGFCEIYSIASVLFMLKTIFRQTHWLTTACFLFARSQPKCAPGISRASVAQAEEILRNIKNNFIWNVVLVVHSYFTLGDHSQLMPVGHFDFHVFYRNSCPLINVQKMSASFRARASNVLTFWKRFIWSSVYLKYLNRV